MTEKQALSFEDAMEKLEGIVDVLEEGNVPLEKAISLYKEGMELANLCHMKLKNIEEQLAEILNEDGEKEKFVITEEG